MDVIIFGVEMNGRFLLLSLEVYMKRSCAT